MRTRDADALPAGVKTFNDLPDDAYVRLPVVRALNGNVHASTIWRWVRNGAYPAPEPIGPNVSAWRVGKLRAARGA